MAWARYAFVFAGWGHVYTGQTSQRYQYVLGDLSTVCDCLETILWVQAVWVQLLALESSPGVTRH